VVADGYVPSLEGGYAGALARADRSRRELRARGLAPPPELPEIAYGLLEEVERDDRDGHRFGRDALLSSSTARTLNRWRLLRNTTLVVTDLYDCSLTLELLGELTCPVWAVYGDRSSCRASMEGLRSFCPTVQTTVLPGAGHLHPMFEPKVFVDGLRGFLRSHPGVEAPSEVSRG
jgi:pimeloyl-ACP methyl ester carboxylesterase